MRALRSGVYSTKGVVPAPDGGRAMMKRSTFIVGVVVLGSMFYIFCAVALVAMFGRGKLTSVTAGSDTDRTSAAADNCAKGLSRK